jgi:hypothetical protein
MVFGHWAAPRCGAAGCGGLLVASASVASLEEECKAEDDTRVLIAGTSYDFAPPAGWTYAMLERATVAQVDDANAVIALTSIVPEKNAKKLAGQRVDAMNDLLALTAVTPKSMPKLTRYKRKKREYSGMEMSVWQYDKVERGQGTGYLMVLTGSTGDHDVVGITFAPSDDADAVKAVLGALGTLAVAEGEEGDGASDDEKEAPAEGEAENEKKGDGK